MALHRCRRQPLHGSAALFHLAKNTEEPRPHEIAGAVTSAVVRAILDNRGTESIKRRAIVIVQFDAAAGPVVDSTARRDRIVALEGGPVDNHLAPFVIEDDAPE